MINQEQKHISKFLSLILRHDPGCIGLLLDTSGYAIISELLERLKVKNICITYDDLLTIVKEDSKQRYKIREDGLAIRANQGHSIDVDLGLQGCIPPNILYHGTASKFVDAICAKGLVPGTRQYVHLSEEYKTAITVGKRHGIPVVFTVYTGKMQHDGHAFYKSENNVWLVKYVPIEYLEIE